MDEIQSGAFKPNAALPSIERIALRMGVSQMTVRQAIKCLCDLGVLYSLQGKGTFVTGMKVKKEFRRVLSFTEETRAHGATPHSKLISFNIEKPTKETRDALGLRPKEKVYRLRRVRFADSLPIGIECSCLAVKVLPHLMESFDPESSLYEELARDYGIQLAITDEVVEVGRANPEESRLLQITPHSPVFLFTRVSFRENGQPIEHVKSTYRGDRYKIVNRLMRAQREVFPP